MTAQAQDEFVHDGTEEPDPPEQMDLIPGLDDVPERVKSAATAYKNASVKKSKAVAAFKGKKETLLDVMLEEEIKAVEVNIDGVTKVIRQVDLYDLREEVKKEPKG